MTSGLACGKAPFHRKLSNNGNATTFDLSLASVDRRSRISPRVEDLQQVSFHLSLLSYFSIYHMTPSSLKHHYQNLKSNPQQSNPEEAFSQLSKKQSSLSLSSLRHWGVLDTRNPNPLHVPSVRDIRNRITANKHQIRAAPRLNYASICEAKVLGRP